MDPAANPVQLTFHANRTYALDYDNDGIKDIWGEYRTSNDWIILKDVGGNFAPDCGHEGAYRFKLTERRMDFNIIADQCPYRAQALAISWERTSTLGKK